MITRLDHVVFMAHDLDATVRDWRERGFTVSPGGRHADGLSHNALVPFRDGSYVELFAFLKDPGEHPWAEASRRADGWCDFALASTDLGTDTAALGELVTRTSDGGRVRPDGVRLAWRTGRLLPPLPFLIEDVTARELRVPGGEAASHANGASRVVRIALGARDPEAVRARYARLRERGAPEAEIARNDHDVLVEVDIR